MPKRLSKYCHHKPTGQAFVRIVGKMRYLGPFNSPESHRRYAELLSEWQAAGKSPRVEVTFGEFSVLYLKHCEQRYQKNGMPTSELGIVRIALRWMNRVAREVQLRDLTPRHLKQARHLIVHSGLSRVSANKYTQRIRQAVKWAVGEEFCSTSVLIAFQAVPDIQKRAIRSDGDVTRQTSSRSVH